MTDGVSIHLEADQHGSGWHTKNAPGDVLVLGLRDGPCIALRVGIALALVDGQRSFVLQRGVFHDTGGFVCFQLRRADATVGMPNVELIDLVLHDATGSEKEGAGRCFLAAHCSEVDCSDCYFLQRNAFPYELAGNETTHEEPDDATDDCVSPDEGQPRVLFGKLAEAREDGEQSRNSSSFDENRVHALSFGCFRLG